MAEGNPPFIRNLASSDLKLRTASLSSLTAFLSARPISKPDALKLWSGLFYALWMSDRPLPQQSLASSLADLQLSAVKPSSAGVWMAAFWEVVGAKWSGIDVLRMEKFLLLVRRVFCAGARWVLEGATKGKGKEGEMRAGVFVEALREGPLGRYEDGDKEMPLGLRLHVVDLWADELDRAGALGDGPAAQTAAAKKMVEGVGELARGLTKGGPSKPLRTKAAESLVDERLPWYEAPAPEEEEAGWEGFGD